LKDRINRISLSYKDKFGLGNFRLKSEELNVDKMVDKREVGE